MMYRLLLTIFGWSILPLPNRFPTKSVMIVAPHTSNWDFFWGLLAGKALTISFRFVIKHEWNVLIIGTILKRLGAIFIDRSGNTGVTKELIRCMNESSHGHVVITPEGTRADVTRWRTGFYHIARETGIPITIVGIDYKQKMIGILGSIRTTGNIKNDSDKIRQIIHGINPKHSDKFHVNWTI